MLPTREYARERVDFVVAGTQKGGTTTLDSYLREHPLISMAARKELHFFDTDENFCTDAVDYAGYHANFAARSPMQLYGECTPEYMYWEPAAARMASYNPALKIIVILRNPITRAYSHWNMDREKSREALPFLEAVQTEPERARRVWPQQLRHRAFVHKGLYAHQLKRLWTFFPVEQTLILRTEELQAAPNDALQRIADFLRLEPFPRVAPRTAYTFPYEREISPEEWQYLAGVFADDIRELERLLGWDCSAWLDT